MPRISRGFGRARGPSVGSKSLPSPKETFPTPETLRLQNRSYRLKSQIKSVLTWHYIFAKYLTRSNNINGLRPAERPSLLKISLTKRAATKRLTDRGRRRSRRTVAAPTGAARTRSSALSSSRTRRRRRTYRQPRSTSCVCVKCGREKRSSSGQRGSAPSPTPHSISLGLRWTQSRETSLPGAAT